MIFWVIAIIVIPIMIVLLVKGKINGLACAITATVLIGVAIGYNCINYYFEKQKFHSFDLAELKRQELIFQTIEFKKFIVQGTKITTESSKYTDEVGVYFVSGHADISFTDIENLATNDEKSDIGTKTLRLDYNNPSRKIPFSISVVINENDIYKVASMESEPIDILGFQKGLITSEMSQSEIVENVKEELKKEFERQIFDGVKAKKLEDSDIYQTFLMRLTEIVIGLSDWESVEVNFMN